jgi:hypothetical protein
MGRRNREKKRSTDLTLTRDALEYSLLDELRHHPPVGPPFASAPRPSSSAR